MEKQLARLELLRYELLGTAYYDRVWGWKQHNEIEAAYNKVYKELLNEKKEI